MAVDQEFAEELLADLPEIYQEFLKDTRLPDNVATQYTFYKVGIEEMADSPTDDADFDETLLYCLRKLCEETIQSSPLLQLAGFQTP